MRTILALTKANVLRFFRDKTYIFFMLIMPVLFLVIFGMLYSSGSFSALHVAVFDRADNEFSRQFMEGILAEDEEGDALFIYVEVETREEANERMTRGEIVAIIVLPETFGLVLEGAEVPSGEVQVYYRGGDAQVGQIVEAILQSMMDEVNRSLGQQEPFFSVSTEEMNEQGLTNFDYVFAGLLGYTIMTLGLIGISNLVPADKESGSVKRIQASPVSATQFVASYLLSYLAIGALVMTIMVAVGLMVFDFQMRGSWLTMAVFSLIGTVMMFGFGLLIAGAAKNEAQASAASNILMMPMMFLSGVFFPVFLMPEAVQAIAGFIPLTPIVEGLRLIMTENFSLVGVAPQLGIIAAWGVVIYTAGIKLFKWD
jgi:ABC-2 type transport system permease protein